MIDERQEELAALYAFDLLEGAERNEWESALARDPGLQALVREFRDSAAALAHLAHTPPPPALRQRVLDSIARADEGTDHKVVRPAAALFARILPWAAAACLAVLAGWLGQRGLSSQAEADLLRDQRVLAEIERQSLRQQLEAERIVTGRQLQDLNQQKADATAQLADVRQRLGASQQELAAAQAELGNRDRLLANLTQRVEALAAAQTESGRQLAEARDRIVRLSDDLKAQGALANLRITALASMLKDAPQALAAAVWDPARQEGVLKVEKLPALLPGQDYQLWVVDPQYPNPVDGGVFSVDPATGEARYTFRAGQPVRSVNAFAVTLERKGGVAKAEGPFVLLGK